jgi:hypothetical protein
MVTTDYGFQPIKKHVTFFCLLPTTLLAELFSIHLIVFFLCVSMMIEDILAGMPPSLGHTGVRLPHQGPSWASVRTYYIVFIKTSYTRLKSAKLGIEVLQGASLRVTRDVLVR